MKIISEEKCFLCGSHASFAIKESASLFREAQCDHCGASTRNNDVAKTIAGTFRKRDSLLEWVWRSSGLRVYESQATGSIHQVLSRLPNYVCSEYFDDVPMGSYRNGVRCENLMRLSFPDNSFHLVVTQDVLEHAQDPYQAFKEIHRVLVPGGFHVFTVPFHEGRPTTRRIIVENNQCILCKPIVYHGDPLRTGGSVVFTDFGEDMGAMLESIDLSTEVIKYGDWYRKDEISLIEGDRDHSEYYRHYETRSLDQFFKYNSIVFRSKKSVDGMSWIERILCRHFFAKAKR